MKSSKILRLVTVALLMLISTTVMAQNSYRETLKQYISLSELDYSEKMMPALKQMNPSVFEYKEGVDFNQLAERYINERLVDVMTDIVSEAMIGTVSENDLRTVISLMSTPEAKTLTKHANAWGKKFEEDIQGEAQESMLAAMDGKTPSPVVANSNIPKDYAKKFMKYMEDTRGTEQFESAFTQSLQMFGVEVPETFTQWVQESLPTLAMNSAYGVITADDLDCSASLFTNDSYRRVIDAAHTLTEDVMGTGVTIILDYVDWMSNQGVNISSIGKQVLDMYKGMGK